MSDILIRDVAESTVAEIDRRASDLGVSRNSICAAGWTRRCGSPSPSRLKIFAGSAGLLVTWPIRT